MFFAKMEPCAYQESMHEVLLYHLDEKDRFEMRASWGDYVR